MQGRRRQIQPANLRTKAIGFVVAEVRRRKGVSQEQLGADCGFDRTYVSRLERGILNPTAIRLWKIAESLKMPFHLMVGEMEKWVAEREKSR